MGVIRFEKWIRIIERKIKKMADDIKYYDGANDFIWDCSDEEIEAFCKDIEEKYDIEFNKTKDGKYARNDIFMKVTSYVDNLCLTDEEVILMLLTKRYEEPDDFVKLDYDGDEDEFILKKIK